jgi:hypothetical protein
MSRLELAKILYTAYVAEAVAKRTAVAPAADQSDDGWWWIACGVALVLSRRLRRSPLTNWRMRGSRDNRRPIPSRAQLPGPMRSA